ncbi:hypothetical protein KY338_01000 [Candidatus Woesearchaeota archaeon]|nr:hypothetical protein [Candidatus Woesearchaeota archaeon]MBW3006175.1 hypothetical protein [Candidatus Woesearchaeota archaeon]
MSKKSAVGVNTLVKILAVVIVLVVFILIIPSFRQVLEGAVETGECQWDMLFSAVLQAGSMGLGGSSQFKSCRAQNVNISMNSLYEYELEAAERMEVYRKNTALYHKSIAQGFGVPEDDPAYYDKQLEWVMNKIIADEMLACWNKVWRGNLPIFDQWWNLVDFTFFGVGTEKPPLEELQNVKYTNLGIFTAYGPPTFCIICSRIKFDRDIRMKFKNKPITSLKEWMADNPAPESKISYLEEFEQGQTLTTRMFAPKYVYTVDEPYAIVYKRVNPHKIVDVGKWLASNIAGLGEEAVTVNQVVIAPYDMIVKSTEKGGLGCYPPVVD